VGYKSANEKLGGRDLIDEEERRRERGEGRSKG